MKLGLAEEDKKYVDIVKSLKGTYLNEIQFKRQKVKKKIYIYNHNI